MLVAKFGNTLTKEERKEIRKEMFKLEKTKFTKAARERAIISLVKLTNALYNKQKYHHNDHHDQFYHGIKDLEHLFNAIDYDDYYKPILVRSSFKNNFDKYEIRGDRDKNQSLKQYIGTITPQLFKLVDEKKNSTEDEQKDQLIIPAVFKHITYPTKKYTSYVRSKSIEMRAGGNTDDILTKLSESFLENYEREENILRN